MHRLICGEEHRLVPWARERIGVSGFDDDARTIGLERDGHLVAVVVYDSFHATDVQMHIASDGTRRWMTRSRARCGSRRGWRSRRCHTPSTTRSSEAGPSRCGWGCRQARSRLCDHCRLIVD